MATDTLVELFEGPSAGLVCDEFRFRELRSIQNEYCISLPHILHVPNGGDLALHLNFKCKVGGVHKDDKLNLAITAFHITARPVNGQLTIDAHGPSVMTAKKSVHINRNTGWGRRENLNELLRKLQAVGRNGGSYMRTCVSALNYNFSRKWMPELVDEWKEKIKLQAEWRSGIKNITFRSSDKTFPSD